MPEDHRLCLRCGGSDSSDVVWTHQDRTVLVTRQKNYETNQDHTRFQLMPDGSLCLVRLDHADAGTFRCNERLVSELEVLTGRQGAGHKPIMAGGGLVPKSSYLQHVQLIPAGWFSSFGETKGKVKVWIPVGASRPGRPWGRSAGGEGCWGGGVWFGLGWRSWSGSTFKFNIYLKSQHLKHLHLFILTFMCTFNINFYIHIYDINLFCTFINNLSFSSL